MPQHFAKKSNTPQMATLCGFFPAGMALCGFFRAGMVYAILTG